MLENKYQAHLIKKIKKRLPGSEVLKNDSSYIQGICDLLILYNNKWAMLEVKIDKDANKQPNQDYYVAKFKKMAYAAFIYPEIEERILNEMERSLIS